MSRTERPFKVEYTLPKLERFFAQKAELPAMSSSDEVVRAARTIVEENTRGNLVPIAKALISCARFASVESRLARIATCWSRLHELKQTFDEEALALANEVAAETASFAEQLDPSNDLRPRAAQWAQGMADIKAGVESDLAMYKAGNALVGSAISTLSAELGAVRDDVWVNLKRANVDNWKIAELVDHTFQSDRSSAANNVRAQMARIMKRHEARIDSQAQHV
jgi:hypothetical protein